MNKTSRIAVLTAVCLLAILCVAYAKTSHREYRNSKPEECRECHAGAGVADTHGAFYVREHRLPAQRGGSNCADCHDQSFCLDCHKGGGITPDLRKGTSRTGDYKPSSHRSDFISIHSIKAAGNAQSCYRCHESKSCNDCHSKIRQKGNMKIKSHRKVGSSQVFDWNADHAAEARRNLQSCESCHPEADVCVQCHYSGKANPHPKNWRSIKQRYKDVNNARTCKKCHIKGSVY